jgi:single-strand DNA-binding protein
MASIAKITLLGRLGKDVELKQSNNGGQSYADFTLATDEPAGKQDGKQTYKTTWWSCRTFGQQAEYAGKWGKKGATVYLEGGVSINEKDGKQYTNVKGNVFIVVAQPGGGNSNGASNGTSSQVNDTTTVEQPQQQQQQAAPPAQRQAAQRTASAPVTTVPASVAADAAASDDELPF